ncbi:unnamed protein product [Cylicostephanus goldi]|uniref:Uncharacterized protein n=1 Tax=Cylicostephanus goldi TaxID=71465 RepID=A0A3P7Q6B3_CYLGO|nr:unnamed protein product [Cylicostephanus goldi]
MMRTVLACPAMRRKRLKLTYFWTRFLRKTSSMHLLQLLPLRKSQQQYKYRLQLHLYLV